jgi:hypothetical protein
MRLRTNAYMTATDGAEIVISRELYRGQQQRYLR